MAREIVTVTLDIQISDGYRRALTAVHGYAAHSDGRASIAGMTDGFSGILANFLDDTMQEFARQAGVKGRSWRRKGRMSRA